MFVNLVDHAELERVIPRFPLLVIGQKIITNGETNHLERVSVINRAPVVILVDGTFGIPRPIFPIDIHKVFRRGLGSRVETVEGSRKNHTLAKIVVTGNSGQVRSFLKPQGTVEIKIIRNAVNVSVLVGVTIGLVV